MTPTAKSHRIFVFGPYRLDLFERVLMRGDAIVSLAPKLFDTLAMLVENSGRVVEKEEMVERLWQDTFVEDSSLSQNIFQLRKILSKGSPESNYIETIPKRGYRFASVSLNVASDETNTTNAEARQAYLLGTYFSNKRTNEALARSIDYFHEAVVHDPEYGPAHAGLADSYFWLAYNETDPEFRRESFELSRASALRAIELDPSAAEGHAALATVKIKHDHDAAGADVEFKKAISVDPNCGMAYSRYAYFLAAMGRLNEALTMIRRDHEIDPLSPDANASLALILYFQRDYDGAIRYCKTALALEPASSEAMLLLGRSYQEKRMFREAAAQYEKAKAISSGSIEPDELLANLDALIGKAASAEAALAEVLAVKGVEQVRPYNVAAIYAALGDEDSAFEWLEQPFINWTERLRMLRFDPRLDNLRHDPRFAKIVELAMSADPEHRNARTATSSSLPQTISVAQ